MIDNIFCLHSSFHALSTFLSLITLVRVGHHASCREIQVQNQQRGQSSKSWPRFGMLEHSIETRDEDGNEAMDKSGARGRFGKKFLCDEKSFVAIICN